MLPETGRVLDPMAGAGRCHELATDTRTVVGVEIEPEGAATHPNTRQGDATKLRFKDASFDAVFTSPTYANRFADKHFNKDSCKHCVRGRVTISEGRSRKKTEECKKCGGTGISQRHSYTHSIRAVSGDPERQLHQNNTGAMQWGPLYRDTNARILDEINRVLVDGGDLVLVISDHVRDKAKVHVVKWYFQQLRRLRFTVIDVQPCNIPRNRNGENAEARVDASLVIHAKRAKRRR